MIVPSQVSSCAAAPDADRRIQQVARLDRPALGRLIAAVSYSMTWSNLELINVRDLCGPGLSLLYDRTTHELVGDMLERLQQAAPETRVSLELRAPSARFIVRSLLNAQPTGDIPIVTQLNPRTFPPTLRTPGPSLSDSDGVLLALETAQALEVRGDTAEAARWLRRAANEAEKQGNDTRVLALAHAAADLTSASAQAPSATPRPATGTPRLGADASVAYHAASASRPRLFPRHAFPADLVRLSAHDGGGTARH